MLSAVTFKFVQSTTYCSDHHTHRPLLIIIASGSELKKQSLNLASPCLQYVRGPCRATIGGIDYLAYVTNVQATPCGCVQPVTYRVLLARSSQTDYGVHTSCQTITCLYLYWAKLVTEIRVDDQFNLVWLLDAHLLATSYKLTTNDIILPYKIVYLGGKLSTYSHGSGSMCHL